jgi:hypothetical protein
MKRSTVLATVSVLAAVSLTAGCSSGSSGSTSTRSAEARGSQDSGSASPSSGAADYNPVITPSDFSDRITNPYFPLPEGRTLVYEGTKDGAPEHVEVVVTANRRTILGVTCVEVSDVVTSNGSLVEKTVDWYAQNSAGDVWYFGEDTKEYTNGVVTSTQGTWEAGVDNAKPGVVMYARPPLGQTYRQEYRPGVAEDMARVEQIDARVSVPAGVYQPAVVTYDTDPLNPDKTENKSYGMGVGLIRADRIGAQHHETIELVGVTG